MPRSTATPVASPALDHISRRDGDTILSQEKPMSATSTMARTVLAHNLAAFTVAEFCRAYRVSRSTLWRLEKEGKAPVIHRAGRRRLISTKAAQEWQQAREAESTHQGAGE